jgi:hypothetical protein
VVVYHTAGNHLFKATLSGDETPKQQLRREFQPYPYLRSDLALAA